MGLNERSGFTVKIEPTESNRQPTRSRFFLWMGVVILVFVFIGFSRTWFLQAWSGAPALPLSLHIHGVIATTWMLVYLAQSILIERNLARIHRRLGIFGAVVAILLSTSAIFIGIEIANSHGGTPEALNRLAVQFVVALTFLLLACLGIWFRRNRESHKRLMLMATIQAATPAIGRFPIPDPFLLPGAVSIIVLLLASVILFDLKTLRRIHIATIFGVAVVVLSIPGRLLLGTTELWTRFAAQIVN